MADAGPRSSPEGQLSNQLYIRRDSPRRNDSPSRQLEFELQRALETISLHDLECHKLHAYQRRAHRQQLDAREVARERADTKALDAARRSRDETRREAEVLLQQVIKEQEEQRRKQEQEERLKREQEAREAKERAERERKAKEEAERQARIQREQREAEEQRRAEEKRRLEAEKAEQKRREETAEQERQERQKAEDERAEEARVEKQRQQDDAAKKQAEQAAAAKQQAASSAATSDDQKLVERQHQDYLKLYEKIKQFKESFWDELSRDKAARKPVGDARRSIRAEFQKITAVDAKLNNVITEKIKQEIMKGLQSNTGSMIPVNNFMPAHSQLNDNDQQRIPAVAAYLLAIFAKQAVQLCTNSLTDQPKLADAFSLTVVKMFSSPELCFEQRNPATNSSTPVTLFPILLAKFHKVVPGLFGITADEKTPTGKQRMGWRLERQPEDNPVKNVIVSEQLHFSRMKGLATGYAAIASRNFAKSKTVHPFPPKNLWLSVARIVNMEPDKIQVTHILLLRSIFTPEVLKRFILFYGNIAIAVLREAFVELPRRLPQAIRDNFETRDMLQMVSTVFEGEEHLHLDLNISNQGPRGFGR